MKIQGIWADEAERFHPSQWVNVYEIDTFGEAIFCYSCQVEELKLDAPPNYGLEPTDADGQIISVKTALFNGRSEAQ
jgi:hypothetical protein